MCHAWPSGQPSLDLRVNVGGVVVGDAVDVQLGRHGLADLAQEREKRLVAVARLARGQHCAVEYVHTNSFGLMPRRAKIRTIFP